MVGGQSQGADIVGRPSGTAAKGQQRSRGSGWEDRGRKATVWGSKSQGYGPGTAVWKQWSWDSGRGMAANGNARGQRSLDASPKPVAWRKGTVHWTVVERQRLGTEVMEQRPRGRTAVWDRGHGTQLGDRGRRTDVGGYRSGARGLRDRYGRTMVGGQGQGRCVGHGLGTAV